MARVNYSAEINELKGSIGGTTFQRNKSGAISKLKASLVYNPTLSQITSRSLFSSLVRSWHSLTLYQQQLWNTFAASYPKYNYWNESKNLSGFNYYIAINSNRSLSHNPGVSEPPVYKTPLFCPKFKTIAISNGLFILFENFLNASDYYLFVFATPPIRSINLQSRRSLRLVSVIAPDNVLSHDITADFESTFNISWPGSNVDNAYNILVAISCVHKDTFLSGQFYLSNTRLNLTFDLSTFGSAWTSVYSTPPNNLMRSAKYLYNGVVMCFENGNKHVHWSDNYGFSFSDIGLLPSSQTVYQYATDFNGRLVLAGGSPCTICYSDDFGLTWNEVYNDAANQYVFSVIFCGNDTWLACTGNTPQILASYDNGITWAVIHTFASGLYCNQLIFGNDNRIITNLSPVGEIWYSDDFGITWNATSNLPGVTYSYEFVYLGNNIVLLSVFEGGNIWKSVDNGLNWFNFSNPGTALRSTSLIQFLPGVVYCGSWSSAIIFVSFDFGSTWSSLGSVLGDVRAFSLALAWYKSLVVTTFREAHIAYELTSIE